MGESKSGEGKEQKEEKIKEIVNSCEGFVSEVEEIIQENTEIKLQNEMLAEENKLHIQEVLKYQKQINELLYQVIPPLL
jgi:hypothetical protein